MFFTTNMIPKSFIALLSLTGHAVQNLWLEKINMSIQNIFGDSGTALWQKFIADEKLTQFQADQFEKYLLLLVEWNKKTNLTRIIDLPDIIAYHFQDSIAIRKFVDLDQRKGIADVGAGGGFPGIPLHILYPEIPMVLIEVNLKKVAFLQEVIEKLEFKNCFISTLDWRTFLRSESYELDFFCARASLRPDELTRMFKPGCRYRNSLLVYWASAQWTPEALDKQYLTKIEKYTVNSKSRVFVFFEESKV
jgi:16S rRNA (guanine(527)-N(7))-methyltransferase RsmG